jgi:hypothetical protein
MEAELPLLGSIDFPTSDMRIRAIELAVEFSKTKNTSVKEFEEVIKIINKYLNVSTTDLH